MPQPADLGWRLLISMRGFDSFLGRKMKNTTKLGFIKIDYYLEEYDFSWSRMMANVWATREAYESLAKSLGIEIRFNSNDITEHQTSISTKVPDLIGRNLFFNFPLEYQELFLNDSLHQLLR